jgi:cytosine/creatinine deaminase
MSRFPTAGHLISWAFAGALKSTAEDRSHRWTAEDIKRRVEFGLRCAYVHGVAAIRTHLDSPELNQAQRSWAVFREVRSEWADRILLQAVALVPIDAFRSPYGDPPFGSSEPKPQWQYAAAVA